METAAEPGFANEALAARVATAVAAVEALAAELNQPQQPGDVLLAERRLELLRRLVGAAQIDIVARIDSDRLHRIDGHRSVKAHTCHVLKVSPAEAARRAQTARALRHLPDIAAALRAGRIGLCHAQVIAQVYANPRITDHVPVEQDRFLRWADTESFDGFKAKVFDWERTVDLDGGFKDNARNHANRNVRLVHNSLDGTWELSGHFASDQGSRAKEIFEHYVEAEWRTDWADARARLGDAATLSDLERTDAQRRADAFLRMCNDAASAPGDTPGPRIVHNIVWSADTYLALADLLGADAAALDTHWSTTLTETGTQRNHWCDPDTYRCSTLDGTPLEPVEQYMSSLANGPASSPAPPASPPSCRAHIVSGPAATTPPPDARSTTSTTTPTADPPTLRTGHHSAGSTTDGNRKASPSPETPTPTGGAPAAPTEASSHEEEASTGCSARPRRRTVMSPIVMPQGWSSRRRRAWGPAARPCVSPGPPPRTSTRC